MPLNCSDCNAICCKSLPKDSEIPNHNGICLFLDSNNKCSIYSDRPLICRVDEGWKEFGGDYTLEEWYKINEESCIKLKTTESSNGRITGIPLHLG